MTFDDFGEVGADVVELVRYLDAGGFRKICLTGHEVKNCVILEHGIADGDGYVLHSAAATGNDHVLHLHRLKNGNSLASPHDVARRDVDGADGALERRLDRNRARKAFRERCCRRRGLIVIL